MITLPPDDDSLTGLLGAEIPSEVVAGVSYRILATVGEGGMSVVFYALRVTSDGETAVVVKVLRPSFVRRSGPTAALIVKKEAIALGRLNEHVPPTPFVVRFIDTGTFPLGFGRDRVELPFVVVEYVHGGREGTTLSERVEYSIRTTGAAFDPARAAHAIECLATGLVAVHDVGVLHRDLKPDNVLCCGFGGDEIFKIADFGVARPVGVATFSGAVVGTPGFVAPELTFNDPKAIGPWSDIFSLAALFFYVLTGEEYFPSGNPAQALVAAIGETRRSILDTAGLSPELRSNVPACRAIDYALSVASSAKTENRPQRADAFAAMLLPWLRVESARPLLLARRLDRPSRDDATELSRWTWTTLRNSAAGFAIRNVAWDADGRCMAATSRGLAFWNGATWSDVDTSGLPDPAGVRFVHRVGPGRWLVGGDGGTFATYTPQGISDVRTLDSEHGRFDRASGEFGDLAVLIASHPGAPPTLCALSGKRWLKPLPLPDVAALSSLARASDATWLISGRLVEGEGFAALYSPLAWEIERLPAPNVRAYLSCAAQPDREVGVVVGASGAVVWRQSGVTTVEQIDGEFDLSAAGIDAVGRGWAASCGRIWMRRNVTTDAGARWDRVWTDPAVDSRQARPPMPIVSLFTDLGVVIGMTADGCIIEGRIVRATADDV